MSSKGPSLSPCPKKSNRKVASPASFTILVNVLLVVLFLLDKKPWQSTTPAVEGCEGRLSTAEMLCPCSSLKVSRSSMRRHSSRVVQRDKWGRRGN